ncbi:putative hydrolase or acyltransferase of alpha/beta superfamily [Herbaspirillum sp. CF444]|uniref:3-oxoadipate enol-lactonase n=1 Tax=Herbaspirillum sp. CF444 TaxID=1144319 RepID=UPI000272697C|nr:3-oxoadipate enol-lactonase [Herbaspirillum sp. CF444]EJL80636.1 putative hydrolase or acyltransferase of alpha/beta superfamily [Herbaspirillum sp. CF444]
MTTTQAAPMSYTLEGPSEAPVLMFSNSLGTTMSLWESQARALRAQYRILRYDTRGHGESPGAAGAPTLAQLGRDVLDLLDQLKLDKVSFCGISMGGIIGLWLGIHAADRVQRLIIANSAAKIGTAEGWRDRAAQVAENGMDGVADGAAGRWFTPAFIARAPVLVDAMVSDLRHCSPRGYAACCTALADADLREQVSRIEAPTLVIAGRHDPVTTVADARFLQDRIAGADYLELAASHLSNVEAGEEFTAGLAKFLA